MQFPALFFALEDTFTIHFVPLSLTVYNQTIGKVLKEVRERGKGTTSKSEEGIATSFLADSSVFTLACIA